MFPEIGLQDHLKGFVGRLWTLDLLTLDNTERNKADAERAVHDLIAATLRI